MKTNRAILIGIIALVVIIGVTFTACNSGGSANANYKKNVESDFEARPIDGGKSAEITGYAGKKWDATIPSKIQNLPVTIIGNSAFLRKNLIKVTIPNSVITIGDGAFAGNQLNSVSIGKSVTTIGGESFANNYLTNVTIPNSVTTIKEEAFINNQLTSVIIPNSVTSIGVGAFDRNQNLTAINVLSGNENYSSADGVLYNKSGNTLVRWPVGKTDTITIPNTVTEIGNYAFFLNQLTSITIPNGVTTIEEYAFARNQLTSVTIPDSVTEIKGEAFADNQLISITIGAGVTLINTYYSASFGYGFENVYNNSAKAAGTYTRPSTDRRTWTKQ